MTAAELIRILQQWPEDTRVIYVDDGCIESDLYVEEITIEDEYMWEDESDRYNKTGRKVIVLNDTTP